MRNLSEVKYIIPKRIVNAASRYGSAVKFLKAGIGLVYKHKSIVQIMREACQKREINRKRSMHYLYILRDPRPGNSTCYVGKTFSEPKIRFKAHFYGHAGGTYAKQKWISQLRKIGLEPIMEILDKVGPKQIKQAEKDIISLMKALHGEKCTNGNFTGWNKL